MNSPFPCGVVEGFYGRPWSFAQRHKVVGWLKRFGLNTYLLAPKDDLKHRVLWRESLDETEAAGFKGLIDECRRQGIRFRYAIAPGWEERFGARTTGRSEASVIDALKRRFQQLIEIGCTDFAVMFDDVPDLPPDRLAEIARQQAEIGNELNGWLSSMVAPSPRPSPPRGEREEAVVGVRVSHAGGGSDRLGPLALCPAVYCSRMAGGAPGDSAYLQVLGERLDPGVDIFWTGPEIISPAIEADHLREVAAVLRRPPFIWDNLHANDYDNARIHLGPFENRTSELPALTRGLVLNQNGACELNFLPLATLGDFVRAGDGYSAGRALNDAIDDWLPEWEGVAGAGFDAGTVRLLVGCFWSPFEYGPLANDLMQHVRDVLRRPPSQIDVPLAAVKSIADQLGRLFFDLGTLKNRELFDALWPHVWRLKDELGLVVTLGEQRRHGKAPPFNAPEHPAGVFRGGLLGDLRELIQPFTGGWRPRES